MCGGGKKDIRSVGGQVECVCGGGASRILGVLEDRCSVGGQTEY